MSAIPLVVQFFMLAGLLACSAFFSSAETAFFALNPIQVRRMGKTNPKAARRVERMLKAPMALLSTILIGNTLVNIAAAATGYTLARHFFPAYPTAVAIPVMTLLLLMFGEVAPKRLAMNFPEKMAARYSPVFSVLIRLLAPFRIALERSASLFQKNLHGADRRLTEEEILTVVEMGEEEGVLDQDERTMVDGIIGLEEIEARDVMTPRVDIAGLDLEDPPKVWQEVVQQARFHYLPLYRDTLDHVEGFLDVARYLLAPVGTDWRTCKVQPAFVPETAPLDTLLRQFQKENQRIAIVADEYGGTAGLITRGDILEEIATDVDSEFGDFKPEIRETGPNRWVVDGTTSLEDINYELGMNLEDEGADRIAGWVAAQAEHIPRAGETVEAQQCRATVQHVRHRRVTQVLIEKLSSENHAETMGEENR